MDIKELTAYEFKRGSVYGVTTDFIISRQQQEKLRQCLDELENDTGVQFFILAGGLKIIEPPQTIVQLVPIDELCPDTVP